MCKFFSTFTQGSARTSAAKSSPARMYCFSFSISASGPLQPFFLQHNRMPFDSLLVPPPLLCNRRRHLRTNHFVHRQSLLTIS
jgi:hypothetical protein